MFGFQVSRENSVRRLWCRAPLMQSTKIANCASIVLECWHLSGVVDSFSDLESTKTCFSLIGTWKIGCCLTFYLDYNRWQWKIKLSLKIKLLICRRISTTLHLELGRMLDKLERVRAVPIRSLLLGYQMSDSELKLQSPVIIETLCYQQVYFNFNFEIFFGFAKICFK